MIKCDYAPCNIELSDTNIKNFILDSVNENFSGFYCSHDHAGFDIIKNVFSNPSAFLAKATQELNINVPANANANSENTATIVSPQNQNNIIPVDLDLDLVTNVNNQIANGNIAPAVIMQPILNESDVKDKISKLNVNMTNLVESILNVSSTSEFPLGKNVVPDAFMQDGVLVERYTFSLYSISPSFTFNITYSPEFMSLVFANDSYNFKIVELDKIFSDIPLTASSLYTKIQSIIKDANGIVDQEVLVIEEPDIETILEEVDTF